MGRPRFKRAVRAAYAAAVIEAEAHGAEVERIDAGGKHATAVIRLGRHRRKLTFSCSPRSDGDNAVDWARQDVRRAISEMREIGR